MAHPDPAHVALEHAILCQSILWEKEIYKCAVLFLLIEKKKNKH